MYSNRAAALTKLLAHRSQDAERLPDCSLFEAFMLTRHEHGRTRCSSFRKLAACAASADCGSGLDATESSEARYPDALRDLDECLKLAGNADSSF